MTTLNSNLIHYNELRILGAFSYPATAHQRALRMIDAGTICRVRNSVFRGNEAMASGGAIHTGNAVTEVTNYYSFIQAFNFSYLGYSSAITVVMVAATVVLSWLIIRLVGWGQPVE